MYCLVQIIDDTYEILSAADDASELTDSQSTKPLRIVLSSKSLEFSMVGKIEKQNVAKALRAAESSQLMH